MKFKEYDVVKILIDDNKVKKGSVGTILEIWNKGEGYEVEFFDENGNYIDCIAVSAEDLELVESYQKN